MTDPPEVEPEVEVEVEVEVAAPPAPVLPPRVVTGPARQIPPRLPTRYFAIRETRLGALVPARLQWLDHEPGEPDNKLDRGCLSIFPVVDIAGVYVEPERLLDRLYQPTEAHPAIEPRHWKYPAPITQADYRLRLDRMRWAAENAPDHPTLRSRRRADPADLPLPNFDRENSL